MANLIQIVKAIKNPQQAQRLMLDKIKQANPQLANVLNNMMSNGTPPKVALQQAIEAGTLTREQFNQAKNMFSQYGRFLPFSVSPNDWNELESVFNSKMKNVSNLNTGFRF